MRTRTHNVMHGYACIASARALLRDVFRYRLQDPLTRVELPRVEVREPLTTRQSVPRAALCCVDFWAEAPARDACPRHAEPPPASAPCLQTPPKTFVRPARVCVRSYVRARMCPYNRRHAARTASRLSQLCTPLRACLSQPCTPLRARRGACTPARASPGRRRAEGSATPQIVAVLCG